MDPFSLATNIVTILGVALTVVEYINVIKDSRPERIRLRDEITNASGPLYMISDRIRLEQKRMTENSGEPSKPWMTSVMALGTPMGPLEQFQGILNELERKIKHATDQENVLKIIGKALVWPFQKQDIERYISTIERLKSLFQLALQNDNLTLTEAVKDDIQAVKENTKLVPAIANGVAYISVKMDEMTANETIEPLASENRTIVTWLSPLNFFRMQNEIFARRTPGTGLWFLNSLKYRSWIDMKGATIWCPGILRSIVVNDLRDQFEDTLETGVVAIYCNYKEQLYQTPVNLLAGIWSQLIQHYDRISDEAKILYHNHLNRSTLPTLNEVENILQMEAKRYQRIFIVVDAFDECPEISRIELLRTIQTLRTKVNLLVTSRFDDSITQAFESSPRLEIGARNKDVLTYISSRISGQLAVYINKDPSLGKEIEETVVKKAQKMFLLPRLQVDSLQQKTSPKAVRKALAMLPNDLDRMYEETLLRIEAQGEDYRQLARRILEWIVFAVRPLSVIELQEALAVEENTRKIDETNIVDPELFTSVCAGLVVIDPASNLVRLVHASTQEYFKRYGFARFPTAHTYIGKTCLTYLSFQEFATGACSNGDTAWLRIQRLPLLQYAVEHWGEHCHRGSEKDMKDQIMEFLNEEKKVSSAVQALHFISSHRFPESMTKLHLAAHFGLEMTVKTLLEQGDDILANDAYGAMALHRASESGQENIVRTLLEHGADIEAADWNGYKAVHMATMNEREEIVLLLLKKGATTSGPIDGRTALHFAAETGNMVIVKAILETWRGANTQSYNVGGDIWQKKFFAGRTPLHWAAQNGHLAVAQTLLEYGAKVNALNSTSRTPLQEAIMFHRVAMVRRLLENGASVATKDISGWTPLHEAAWQSQLQIAEILIEYGAEIDAVNIQNPADARLPGVEADIDEVGSLHLATYIKLYDLHNPKTGPPNIDLPENTLKAMFNSSRKEVGCTPLHLAVARGDFDLFRLLKSHKADLEFCDKSGLVPLHRTVQAKSSEGSLKIIQSLLESGVNIDRRDKRRQETTLQIAARLGKVNVVKYLLEKGADIEVINAFGENTLQVAEAKGHVEVQKLLNTVHYAWC